MTTNMAKSQFDFKYDFIGREDSQKKFEDLLNHQKRRTGNSQYVFARGGIGKTRLLVKYICINKNIPDDSYVEAQKEVIDFYNIENRSVLGLRRIIRDRVGKKYFNNFNELDEKYQELEQSAKDATGRSGRLSALQFETTPIFFDELTKVPEEIRSNTVLVFDTFELVYNRAVGDWFLKQFVPEAVKSGLLVIFAGRTSPDKFDLPPVTHKYELAPFTETEALNYFKTKYPVIKLGNYELGAIKATQGLPLLLDLIAFFHDKDLDLEVTSQEELESSIIKVFLREEEPYNKVFREMAYLKHRYDQDIFEYRKEHYAGISDFESLKVELTNLPFLKYRSSEEAFALHDAFRDMFEKHYVRWHGMAIELYQDILKWYETAIIREKGLKKSLLQAEKLAYVLNLGGLDEKTLQGEKDYQLARSLLKGYSDQNSDELNWLLINDISSEVVRRFPTANDRYEVFSLLGNMAKRVHRLTDAQLFWAGAVDATKTLGDPKLQVNAMIEQHNSTWQSDLKRSFDLLEQAAALCGQDIEMQARVQYEVGFTYRHIYDFTSAIDYYHKALRIALSAERNLEIRTRLGTIYNDLGYTYLLVGDYDKAEVYISKARTERIDILKWLSDQLDNEKKGQRRLDQIDKPEDKIEEAHWRIGLTFNTLGDLARYSESFDLASIEYSEAVAIFRKNNFRETDPHLWLSIALHQRGDAYRQIAVLASRNNRERATEEYSRRAYEDITESIQLVRDHGLYEIGATAYRRLARLKHDEVWRIENPDVQLDLLNKVYDHLNTALVYARNNHDSPEALECLREIAFLADDRAAVLMKKFGYVDDAEKRKMDGYIEQFREGIERHEKKEFQIYTFNVFKYLFTLVEAAYAFSLGDDYNFALKTYIEAFVSLASSPGYGVGCYRKHRPHLWERIRSLDREQRKEWCERFRSVWKSAQVRVREGGSEITKSLAEVHPKMYEWLTVEIESLGG